MARSPRSRLVARFHKIPYANIFPGILTDAGRPCKMAAFRPHLDIRPESAMCQRRTLNPVHHSRSKVNSSWAF